MISIVVLRALEIIQIMIFFQECKRGSGHPLNTPQHPKPPREYATTPKVTPAFLHFFTKISRNLLAKVKNPVYLL